MQSTKQKLKKAENLRNKAIYTEKESSKAVNAWVKTTLGTADYEQARKASNRAEEKADKAYDAYYNYVHANFEKEKIDQSFHKVCQDKKSKKNMKVAKEAIDPEILDNAWNVHNVRTDPHPKIVMAKGNDTYLISHTTTEITDKANKFPIKNGLYPKQKDVTYVKRNSTVLKKKKLQSKIKGTRITTDDKLRIYDKIKDNPGNIQKYKSLKKGTE